MIHYPENGRLIQVFLYNFQPIACLQLHFKGVHSSKKNIIKRWHLKMWSLKIGGRSWQWSLKSGTTAPTHTKIMYHVLCISSIAKMARKASYQAKFKPL
jgi:hypothetical protein